MFVEVYPRNNSNERKLMVLEFILEIIEILLDRPKKKDKK